MEDPTKAAGGNVLGHASTYRIYLRKSGENRIAKMIDSPYHPYSDARFTVNERGTDDIEDVKKSGKKASKDEIFEKSRLLLQMTNQLVSKANSHINSIMSISCITIIL